MNLSRIIERHAQFIPDKVAVHCDGVDLSYRALWQQIEATTDRLWDIGVRPGDRLAWLGLNDPRMLVLLFALARIGGMLLPLNYRLAGAEQRQILEHAQAAWLVADASYAVQARTLAQETGCILLEEQTRPSDRAAGAVAAHISAPTPAAAGPDATAATAIPTANDPDRATDSTAAADAVAPSGPAELVGNDASGVLLVYTSGTSGTPKGALHTQAALLWNCFNASHAHDLTSADHVLTILPLFHVGGLCIQTLPALHAGATITLQRRFSAAAWIADVQVRRPGLCVMVPATMRAVLEHSDWAAADLSSLRLITAGSSVVPRVLIDAFHARGVMVGQVYGATETGPVSIYLRRQDALRAPGSAGKAALHVQVRLVDEQGHDVAPGEVGEIWIRGPNLMQGYWGSPPGRSHGEQPRSAQHGGIPDAPEHPSFQNGWFHSGDLARCDEEGFYWVVGRSTDMIISGGENIYPAEIENLLVECPQIAEVAVLGCKDPTWGEVAVAAVVLVAGASMGEQQVLALLHGRLARFKIPRRIVFCDVLPRTALGKVRKQALLEQVEHLLNQS